MISQEQLSSEESQLHNPTLERQFLACLIKSPDLMLDAQRQVNKYMFFVGENAYVYEIMCWIYNQAIKNKYEPRLDSMSMFQAARNMGPQFEQRFWLRTNGMEQIRFIEAHVEMVSRERFPEFMHNLRDIAMRVKMYRMARRTQQQALSIHENPDAGALAQRVGGEMYEMSAADSQGAPQLIRLDSVREAELIKYALTDSKPEFMYLPMLGKMPKLWKLFGGGPRRKKMAVVAARPKTGKTSFAMDLAIHTSVTLKYPVLYMDSEMSAEEMFSRSLSNLSHLDETDILLGKCFKDADKVAGLNQAIGALANSNLIYVGTAGMHPKHIGSIMRMFRDRHVGQTLYTDPASGRQFVFSNPALVIYDWIKLPDPDAYGKNTQDASALGYLAGAIKYAARDNDLSVVALAQNNRSTMMFKKQSDWEDQAEGAVYGSDKIAQFCDALMSLRNLTRQEAAFVAAKGQRDGKPGTVEDPNSLQFNQILTCSLNRSGPDMKTGIPLYLNRGTARYDEMSDDPSIALWNEVRNHKSTSSQVPLGEKKKANIPEM